MELLEARLVLDGTYSELAGLGSPEVDAAVNNSDQILDDYSSSVQEQYSGPVQSTLESAVDSWIADTAWIAESAGSANDWSDTPIAEFFGSLPMEGLSPVSPESSTDTGASSDSLSSVADGSSTMGTETSSSTTAAASTTTSASASLFDQNADLQTFANNLPDLALGGLMNGGSTTGSGPTVAGNSGTPTTSGSGSSLSVTTGGTTGGLTTTTSTAAMGQSNTSAGGGSSSTPAWVPFTLPSDVVFADSTLPLQSLSDWRSFTPTRLETFVETTVTETEATTDIPATGTAPAATHIVTTKLTITIAQTYVAANQWLMSQSWTKEFTVSDASGDASGLGSWTLSQRTSVATFRLTVSLGFGVPTLPVVGAVVKAASAAAAAAATAPSAVASAAASSLPPPPTSAAASASYSDSDTFTRSVGDSWNNSDPSSGMIDTGSYSGTTTITASRTAAINETVVTLPDSSLGKRYQAAFSVDRVGTLSFTGQYDQFDADGTVLDATDAPTTDVTHPMSWPMVPRGQLPASDPGPLLDNTAPPPVIGPGGWRYEAHGNLNLGGTVSSGSYLSGEATIPAGMELAESGPGSNREVFG